MVEAVGEVHDEAKDESDDNADSGLMEEMYLE